MKGLSDRGKEVITAETLECCTSGRNQFRRPEAVDLALRYSNGGYKTKFTMLLERHI
jgi:hypothetical protein